MNWQQIINESVLKQKNILNKAKDEGRAVTEDEAAEIKNLTEKISDAKKQLDIENSIIANEKNVSEIKAVNEIPNGIDAKVIKNPPKWENGIGSLFHAVRESAKTGNIDNRFINAQGANETIPSDGGFLVGSDDSMTLIEKMHKESVLASKCTKIGINGNRYTQPYLKENSRVAGSRWGGILAYWVKEAGTITKSRPEFGRLELELEKIAALVYATNELLEDAAAFEGYLNKWLPLELAFQLDDAIINGNGAGKPTGILNSSGIVTVAKESGQTANTILFDNILKMWSRMHAASRAKAVFYINQDVEPQLNTMTKVVGTGGVPVYLPAGGLSESPYATLMGRPVIPIEQCSTLGTKGDIILGDFSQYLLIEKKSNKMKMARSMHVAFDTDEEVFRVTYRVDGQNQWPSALTPFKGTATQAPFVVLATRS